MLKMKKLTLAIAMATALAGCANIGDSYKASQQDYQNYAEITKQFNVKENWIGAQGQKIKTIGMEARADMERLFDNKVHLELWVKVKSGWADDERALRSLGYMDE